MRKAGTVGPLLLVLASFLVCLGVQANARPPRGAKAPASGSAQRYDPVLRLGGAQLDLEALRDEAIEHLKGRITEAIEEQATELKTAFDDTADAQAQQIYNDFLYWLNERVRAKLLRQYPHLKTEAEIEARYAEWLESPDQELSSYVDLYLSERAPAIKWLLDAYRDEASWEIAGGIEEIYDDAQGKLKRFTEVVGDAERDPNAPTSELLRKHGLSGDWVDNFEAHEDRFRTFDDKYKVVEATQILVSAFQTRVPREKIGHLTDLLSLMGGAAEDSNIPIVSLFGQIVKAYGDVSREMLGQVDALSKQLRQRAGYCVGAGATGDDRHRAFVRQFGSRDQACPTRLKDVYERTLPADGRIYFFVDGRFLAGREDNGEFPAVLRARGLIHAAVAQGDTTWQRRENDLEALAEVYNVAYDTEYGKGIQGLMREAEETMAGISRRQRELERGLSSPCGLAALQRAIERETGLRSSDGVEPVAGNEQRLAVRYAVGFIRGGGAHVTYSRIWSALRELSLIQVSGEVVAQGGGACTGCAQAALQIIPNLVQQIPGCETTHADRSGRFVVHALTRSPDFRIAFSASGGGQRSAAVSVNRVVAGVERIPFVKEFSGLRLELPVVSAAPSPIATASRTPTAATGPASEGVVTTNPTEGAAASGAQVPPAPASGTPTAGLASPGAAAPATRAPAAPSPVTPVRTVPDVMGLTADAAGKRMAAAGLVADFVGGDPAPSADREFKVQEQMPDAGTLAAPGGRVKLRVHSAFERRQTVPGVEGLAASVADQRLKAAGFVVQMAGGDAAPSADRAFTVQDQRPASGEPALPGSTVVVRVFSRISTRRIVPDIVGMSATEAERRLGEVGLTAALQGGDPAPTTDRAFTVQTQQPAAGAAAEAGGSVQIRIHSAYAAPRVDVTSGTTSSRPAIPAGSGDPGVFACSAFRDSPARPQKVHANHYAQCGPYRGVNGDVLVQWRPPGDPVPWQGHGPGKCGVPPDVRFNPAFETTGVSATIGNPSAPREEYKYWVPASMTAVFWGSTRQVFVRLSWPADREVPLPPEFLDLGRRLLAEAEWRADRCDGSGPRPAAGATTAQPPRPAVSSAPSAPVDQRPRCTCKDEQGKGYRMVLDQPCDPAGLMRTDDCVL